MRIAFPALKAEGLKQEISQHFGPSPYFIVLGSEGEVEASVKNTSSHFGGSKMPAEVLAESGIGAIVCVDMGPKAIEMCRKLGIAAYFAPQGATIAEAFALFGKGKLCKAKEGDGCEGHSH